MKYFNHLSCAGEDSKVQKVRDEFGLAGYGAYFLILEKISAQIRKESGSTSMTLALRKWAQHLDATRVWTRKLIFHCHAVGLWRANEDGSDITINVPNLLKYADEYSKKIGIMSRQSPDSCPESVPNPGSKAVRKDKRSTPTPPASAVEAAEPSSAIESPQARAEAMKTIRKAMAELPGAHPQQQVPKAQDSGNGKIPRAEGQEVEDMGVKLELEGFVDPAAQDILDAWWARKQGTHNEYALAAMLDKHNIKGQDRSKVYRCLGVV